ncbi:MAG: hypothetical protein CMK59_15540 [Proteobacteria bacterium]|nr:hypothetical protein [Pseudomonadota bacterium]
MLYLLACQDPTNSAAFSFKKERKKESATYDSAREDTAQNTPLDETDQNNPQDTSQNTAELSISVPEFYPRGSAINAVDGTLYVSSHGLGLIHQATSIHQNNTSQDTSLFTETPADSLAGMRYNGGSLWVCANPRMGLSGLLQIDPYTGAVISQYPMAENTTCHSVNNDNAGNIFVSDSQNSHIWKLSLGGGALEQWYTQDSYKPEYSEGFSGIVMSHAQDAVLVGHMETGNLYRIPILEDGSAGDAIVESFDRSIVGEGINGVAWHEGKLYVIRDRQLLKLEQSSNSWSSEVLADFEHPTSFVFFRGGNGVVWVVESQLDAYFDETSSTQVNLPFKIIQVPL